MRSRVCVTLPKYCTYTGGTLLLVKSNRVSPRSTLAIAVVHILAFRPIRLVRGVRISLIRSETLVWPDKLIFASAHMIISTLGGGRATKAH